jgi:hypothetical protein
MATHAHSVPGANPAIPSTQGAQLLWTTVGWFGTLLIACYAPVLWGLVRKWATDEDMGHGYLVPLVTGYMVWRQRLESSRVKPARNY